MTQQEQEQLVERLCETIEQRIGKRVGGVGIAFTIMNTILGSGLLIMAFYMGVGYSAHEQRITHLEQTVTRGGNVGISSEADKRLTILENAMTQAKEDIKKLFERS